MDRVTLMNRQARYRVLLWLLSPLLFLHDRIHERIERARFNYWFVSRFYDETFKANPLTYRCDDDDE
ncbi:MAG: hypothetical protein LBE22_10470 [Azoarcus sp.]|jgi:hypothetical protein|nr:hypothetical protein [Azoarcus sp.]